MQSNLSPIYHLSNLSLDDVFLYVNAKQNIWSKISLCIAAGVFYVKKRGEKNQKLIILSQPNCQLQLLFNLRKTLKLASSKRI